MPAIPNIQRRIDVNIERVHKVNLIRSKRESDFARETRVGSNQNNLPCLLMGVDGCMARLGERAPGGNNVSKSGQYGSAVGSVSSSRRLQCCIRALQRRHGIGLGLAWSKGEDETFVSHSKA